LKRESLVALAPLPKYNLLYNVAVKKGCVLPRREAMQKEEESYNMRTPLFNTGVDSVVK